MLVSLVLKMFKIQINKILGNVIINFCFLVLSTNYFSYGLISPIEVVEEWGCYDSEIRLTCGNLDSKIAILEAIFTPDCTQNDCSRDELKRLNRAFSSPKTIDFRTIESQGGGKYLKDFGETQNDDSNLDRTRNDENYDSSSSSSNEFNSANITDLIKPRTEYLHSPETEHIPQKTASLEHIEHIILKYLRELSPNQYHHKKVKRFKTNEKGRSSKRFAENIMIGERNITINENQMFNDDDDDRRHKKVSESISECPEQRRKITALNNFDIEKSLKNESHLERNIREVLNKRCSGKNHCSFLFAFDHPLSRFWRSGMVRIKYICMEDYRINHYCNEHLIIGKETTPETFKLGEPIAEARVQLRDQGFHSLKILKSSDEIEATIPIPTKEYKQSLRKKKLQRKSQEPNGSPEIYSQDFKILKILPNNLDDFHDITKIGDEIYFRTDQESSEHLSSSTSTIISTTLPNNITENLSNNDNKFSKIPSSSNSSSDNVTLIIREGEYIIRYPKEKIITTTGSPITTKSGINSTTENVSEPSTTSVEDIVDNENWRTVTQSYNVTENLQNTENEYEMITTNKQFEIDINNIGEENRIINNVDDNLDENNFKEIDEINIVENYKPNFQSYTYTSIQRTMFKRPLTQGFTMTPGYPKFYVGDSECKWTIIAPVGQKIQLNILDISLRREPICRDFVMITDIEMGHGLFNSCTESNKPLQVVSDSNQIEVIVKTTSKFAYPKRGVLIHYSGWGCVTPSPPLNGELISRKQMTAIFECKPTFVFSDTGTNSSKIVCVDGVNWDRILPDCVEKLAVTGSGLVSTFNFNSQKRLKNTSTQNMESKEADMVYDIIIPSMLIAGLFVANAVVFVVIMLYRKRNVNGEPESKELAEL